MAEQQTLPTETGNELANFAFVPEEVALDIFKMLPLPELICCERVSRRFNEIIDKNILKLKKKLEVSIEYRSNQGYYASDFYVWLTNQEKGRKFQQPTKQIRIWNGKKARRLQRPYEFNEHEEFLDCVRMIMDKDEFEKYDLTTVRSADEILKILYTKFARYCNITFLTADARATERASSIGPFGCLTDVAFIQFRNIPWTIENIAEVQKLDKLDFFNYRISNEGAEPFDVTTIGDQVRDLCISFDTLQTGLLLIDDAELLRWNCLKSLVLGNTETELTLNGFGAVIDEWREGRREIFSFMLNVDVEEDLSESEILAALHVEEDNVNIKDIIFKRANDDRELAVSIGDFDSGHRHLMISCRPPPD